jgi:hypothetical protein
MSDNENELHPYLLGICGMNPWFMHNSASRMHMMSSHLGQMLTLNHSSERRFQTGMERKFGEYTFNVKIPVDAEVLHLVERYANTGGPDSIEVNPQTIVIYEDVDTKVIGMVSLTDYCSNHQYFGFKYVQGKDLSKVAVGAKLAKDSVLLESPSITDEGDYKYGLQGNVAFMSLPSTSEDGVLVNRNFLPKMGFRTYETRISEWGSKKLALNLYGDRDEQGNFLNYKAYPDIGQVIRPDGLLMATRSYDPLELAVVEQGINDLAEVDFTFDTTLYANGPGGRVVDIKIHHGLNRRNFAECHMDEQSQKYDDARRAYFQRIVKIWTDLHRQRGDALELTPELHRFVVEAQSVVSEVATGQGVSKMYRKTPLDDYWVEFTIEYDTIPGTGFKITDLHGG